MKQLETQTMGYVTNGDSAFSGDIVGGKVRCFTRGNCFLAKKFVLVCVTW